MTPVEGPPVRELREIAEGKRDFPNTTARRHHFVPAFVLAEFATPRGDRKSFMAQLDTTTGRPNRTTPNDSCFVKDLYAQAGDAGRDNTLEAFFSIVGKEHLRRGWPRGLWVPGDDGRPEFVAYTLLEPGDPRHAARTGAELGRRIIAGAVAEGLATAENLGVNPEDAT